MLNLLSFRVSEILKKSCHDLDILNKLRDSLRVLLSDDEFRLSCIATIVDSIQNWTDKGKPWNSPPIITDIDSNYSVRMIYWPSYFEVNPHKHKTWGVTGLFQNQVDVNIFELYNSPRRLSKTNTVIARQGEVGYVQSGCIHNIRNNNYQIASTLHIFNNLPGIESPEENAIWYPSPRHFNISDGLVSIAMSSSLDTLKEINTTNSIKLIKDIYHLGSDTIKFKAIQVLCDLDLVMAKSLFDIFCSSKKPTNLAA